MMQNISRTVVFLPVALLVACVHVPSGPSMMVLPGAGKNFDQFRSDDFFCRQYASQQTDSQTPRRAALSSGVESAAVGAALGAAAGAALGGGRGAAIGAGTGFLGGGLAGSGAAQSSGTISQERYDISYIQCMYAYGHRVPVSGGLSDGFGGSGINYDYGAPAHPSGRYIPPPPPGSPPPPPPY